MNREIRSNVSYNLNIILIFSRTLIYFYEQSTRSILWKQTERQNKTDIGCSMSNNFLYNLPNWFIHTQYFKEVKFLQESITTLAPEPVLFPLQYCLYLDVLSRQEGFYHRITKKTNEQKLRLSHVGEENHFLSTIRVLN